MKIVTIDRFHKQDEVVFDPTKPKQKAKKQHYRVDQGTFNGMEVTGQDVWAIPLRNKDHDPESRRYLIQLDEDIKTSKNGPTVFKKGDLVVASGGGEFFSDYIYLTHMNFNKTIEANDGKWPRMEKEKKEKNK